MQDILFKTGNFVFSYRIGGVLIQNNKILLQKVPNDDGYALPGGHISFGETSDEALIREFREEFHADIRLERLLMVGENFCPWGNLPCQQINLYYLVSLSDATQIPSEGIFHGFDEQGNVRTDVEFHWIELDSLSHLKVYPFEAKPYLITLPEHIVHFQHR